MKEYKSKIVNGCIVGIVTAVTYIIFHYFTGVVFGGKEIIMTLVSAVIYFVLLYLSPLGKYLE